MKTNNEQSLRGRGRKWVHEVTEHANLCSQHHLGGSEPPPGLFPRSRTRFPSACEGVFHLRLRCCLCAAPAPPKDAGFSWEELLPGSVHAEKGAGPRGAASPRSGWEMISLCFYPFECSAERPGRELMQQLQHRERLRAAFTPRARTQPPAAMDAASGGFVWILAPLSPRIAGDGAAVPAQSTGSRLVLQVLGHKNKGRLSPSLGAGAGTVGVPRAGGFNPAALLGVVSTMVPAAEQPFPAWKKNRQANPSVQRQQSSARVGQEP